MLKITELSKRYDNLIAVDQISFEVKEGEIYGFLGPNGAGKTTTINMICGLIKPDSGTIELNEQDLNRSGRQARKHIGVVPQEIALYEELSVSENLKFWGGLYCLKGKKLKSRMDELLDVINLKDRAKNQVKTLSGGMKRRLNMAAGLIHDPKLLLLDEPTVGIDPQARHNMLETIQDIARGGTTIIYTTHYMDEAEMLCDRVAIIDHGRILAKGTQDELKQIVGENRLLQVNGKFDRETAENLPKKIKGLNLLTLGDTEVVYTLPFSMGTGEFLNELIQSGFNIDNLIIKEPNLDSLFIKLTGRELRE